MMPTLPSAPALALVLDPVSGQYSIKGTTIPYRTTPITPEILVDKIIPPIPEYASTALPNDATVDFGGETYASASDNRLFRLLTLDAAGGVALGGVQVLTDAQVKAGYQLPPMLPAVLSTSTPDQVRTYVASFSGASAQLAAALSIACSLASMANQAPAPVPLATAAPQLAAALSTVVEAIPVTNESVGLGTAPPLSTGFDPTKTTIENGFQANPTS